MEEIQGYKLMTLVLNRKRQSGHTIFAKENNIRVKNPEKPNGKTLFLLNIPPYVTEENLKTAFSTVGEIVSVILASKAGRPDETTEDSSYDKFTSNRLPFIFKVAYIVFKSTTSLQNALEMKTIDLYNEKGKTIVKSGIEKWMQEYIDNIPDEDALQAEINEFMDNYDKKEQETIEAEKSSKNNEGWITVGKRGRNAGFEQKESVINKLEGKVERGKKKNELKNFYTFQIRESKMQNIVSLRKKFEEDKRKIEAMKKSRRFKPF